MDFKKDMDTKGFSDAYKDVNMVFIRAFYGEHDILLPKNIRTNSRSDRKEVLYDDLPTIGDIQHILKYAGTMYRATILMGLSSGMSKAEICQLTLKDLFEAT